MTTPVDSAASVAAAPATATNGHATNGSANVAVDAVPDMAEVGFLFVQQYYTFLSEQPRRLHLFYTLESTLTHGVEGENNETCNGQPLIAQRIKEHGFDECKVLLSSVDCQASANGGAVIQVLGEMANKGGKEISQKFVQTFFLAPQVPRGYFVLNDIFRFLKEDVANDFDDVNGEVNGEVVEESSLFSQPLGEKGEDGSVDGNVDSVVASVAAVDSPVATPAVVPAVVPVVSPAASVDAPVAAPVATAVVAPVEEKAEQVEEEQPTPVEEFVEEPSTEKEEPTAAAPEVASEESVVNPEATPVAAPVTTSAPTSASTSAPFSWAALAAKPKTNGSIESSSNGSPVVPIATAAIAPAAASTVSASSAATAPTAAAVVATPNASTTSVATSATSTPSAPTSAFTQQQKNFSKQRPQVEYHSAYIKHVSHRVDDNLLKKALEKIGQMTHFQVEKNKNCAFVDFVDAATLKAALAVHELQVGDQTVLIEERKRGGAKKNSFQRKSSSSNNSNNNPSNTSYNNNGFKKPFQKV